MGLEEIRQQGESFDTRILRLLDERAKYLYNPDLSEVRNHPILLRDSCLQTYMQGFYSQVLNSLCQKGSLKSEVADGVINLDRTLAYLIMQRTTTIGEQVARHKHPRGLPVYVPEVEARKIQERINQAEIENLNLTPEQISTAFDLIFKETKRIEEMIEESTNGQATSGIETRRTACKDMLESIKSDLQYVADRLGGKHSVGTREEKTEAGTIYIATLY